MGRIACAFATSLSALSKYDVKPLASSKVEKFRIQRDPCIGGKSVLHPRRADAIVHLYLSISLFLYFFILSLIITQGGENETAHFFFFFFFSFLFFSFLYFLFFSFLFFSFLFFSFLFFSFLFFSFSFLFFSFSFFSFLFFSFSFHFIILNNNNNNRKLEKRSAAATKAHARVKMKLANTWLPVLAACASHSSFGTAVPSEVKRVAAALAGSVDTRSFHDTVQTVAIDEVRWRAIQAELSNAVQAPRGLEHSLSRHRVKFA